MLETLKCFNVTNHSKRKHDINIFLNLQTLSLVLQPEDSLILTGIAFDMLPSWCSFPSMVFKSIHDVQINSWCSFPFMLFHSKFQSMI